MNQKKLEKDINAFGKAYTFTCMIKFCSKKIMYSPIAFKPHRHQILIEIIFFLSMLLCFQGSKVLAFVPDWTTVTYEPFNLIPAPDVINPVLTANDVTDVYARFVADPFILVDQGTWYMFFEVFSETYDQGMIGLATSPDGLQWQYEKIVLAESVHLSYPHVIKNENNYYMIPESADLNEVRIYQATNFPYVWEYAGTLVSGKAYVDASIFSYNGKWWMFAGEVTSPLARGNCRLFFSDNLLGGWVEHPQSPIVIADISKSRPAGRSFVFDTDRIIRTAQKGDVRYGQRVRAFELEALSETQYSEHEITQSPILYESSIGWNATGMHHFDPWWVDDRWLCAVDGVSNENIWSIGIYAALTSAIPYNLMLSNESDLTGAVLLDGASLMGDIYVFVFPEEGVQSVRFETLCNDFYHEQLERFAPWEAIGGEPITNFGDCTVNATVYTSDGKIVDLAANFVITEEGPQSPCELYCSPDDHLDGNDPLCDGEVFSSGVYVFVLSEEGVNSVEFATQCNGFYHEQHERYEPWEALGGEPIIDVGDCTVNATVYESNGGTVDLTANFEIEEGGPLPPYELYCSPDAFLDQSDPSCDGEVFNPGVYVFVLSEEGITSVEFATQCNGFYHEQHERYEPWEALGGEPITEMGNCTVDATVYESDGGTVNLTANFNID